MSNKSNRSSVVDPFGHIPRTVTDNYPLSPYSTGGDSYFSNSNSNSNANSLRPTLSRGISSDIHNLTKTMTHPGHSQYEMKNINDLPLSVYQTIHLTTPVPNILKPVTPSQVFDEVVAQFYRSNQKCDCKPSIQPCEHLKALDKNKKPLHSALSKGKTPSTESRFATRVSFDTVNIQYAADNNSPLDEDEFEDEVFDRRYRRGSSASSSLFESELSPLSRAATNERSLSPRSSSYRQGSISPVRSMQDMKTMAMASFRKYPTTPIITHDACTLTKKHNEFDDLYTGRLMPKVAKLPNRNILCYVSGRRHTWVSIDWCCNRLLEDGDSLIVIASIRPNSKPLTPINTCDIQVTPTRVSDSKIRQSPEYAKAVTKNLMKYILSVLNPNKIIKITIELAVGDTKDVLKDMYSLYLPSLVVTSAKPSLAPSTKSWLTSRITDRLVKNFPVPLIIVSPKNMDLFETKLFKALDKRMQCFNKNQTESDSLLNEIDLVGFYNLEDQREYIRSTGGDDEHIIKELNEIQKEHNKYDKVEGGDEIDEDHAADEGDEEVDNQDRATSPLSDSTDSTDSTNSTASAASAASLSVESDNKLRAKKNNRTDSDDISVDSTNPPAFVAEPEEQKVTFRLKRLELDTQISIYKELRDFDKKPVTEDTFKHFLAVVSDASYNYGVQLAEAAKKGGEESKLVRTLTGAPDTTYMRRKSMLFDDDDESYKCFSKHPSRLLKSKSAKSAIVRSISPQSHSRGSVKIPAININSPVIEGSGKPRNSSLKFDLPDTKSGPKSAPVVRHSKSTTCADELTKTRSVSQLTSVKSDSSGKTLDKKKKGFFSKFFSKNL